MDSTSFLSELYPERNGYIELRLIKDSRPIQVFVESIDAIKWDDLAKRNTEGYNVFFGVCLRGRKEGTKEAVSAIPALWADCGSIAPVDICRAIS